MDTGSRRWRALGAVSLSVLAVILDGTVLSVPLPTLAKALHASESDLEWLSFGYLLALPLGPILGGWMLSQFWWGWVFLINVPIVSEEHSGIGSAVAQAFQKTVGSFGTAITGTDVSLLVSAGIAVAGVILTLIFLPRAAALQRSGLSMKEATRASEH